MCEFLNISPRRGREILHYLVQNEIIVSHGGNRNRFYTPVQKN